MKKMIDTIRELIIETPTWQTLFIICGISFLGSLFVCGFSPYLLPFTALNVSVILIILAVILR